MSCNAYRKSKKRCLIASFVEFLISHRMVFLIFARTGSKKWTIKILVITQLIFSLMKRKGNGIWMDNKYHSALGCMEVKGKQNFVEKINHNLSVACHGKYFDGVCRNFVVLNLCCPCHFPFPVNITRYLSGEMTNSTHKKRKLISLFFVASHLVPIRFPQSPVSQNSFGVIIKLTLI